MYVFSLKKDQRNVISFRLMENLQTVKLRLIFELCFYMETLFLSVSLSPLIFSEQMKKNYLDLSWSSWWIEKFPTRFPDVRGQLKKIPLFCPISANNCKFLSLLPDFTDRLENSPRVCLIFLSYWNKIIYIDWRFQECQTFPKPSIKTAVAVENQWKQKSCNVRDFAERDGSPVFERRPTSSANTDPRPT